MFSQGQNKLPGLKKVSISKRSNYALFQAKKTDMDIWIYWNGVKICSTLLKT